VLKSIFVNGIDGNMGKRYATILRALGVEVTGGDTLHLDLAGLKRADGFIIATPTQNHLADIKRFLKFKKPILCEKPFTRSRREFDSFIADCGESRSLISMVNQYQYLIDPSVEGHSVYDYFKSGNDGLYWDTINIIGLSKEFPTLKNDSPIWRCTINGNQLNLADMDFAYIRMLKAWLSYPEQSNWNYAIEAHLKVFKFFEGERD
jgi:hypothetical protein